MPLTIKLITFLLLGWSVAYGQRREDLSLWTWVQVEKKLPRKQYVEFQYQARFDQNISQFNRSNLYFVYGRNFLKHFQAEALYQLNLNHWSDQHTAFLGLSYKYRITDRFSLYSRTAFQYIRDGFTGNAGIDRPYSEWRNRLRFICRFNNLFSVAVSAEPYLKFEPGRAARFSRARYVGTFVYRFNKYQSFSAFYLVQPDLNPVKAPKTVYAIGLTYHVRIPGSAKGLAKFFNPKSPGRLQDDNRDTQN